MKIKLGKNIIEFFDSAESMDIVRYQKLNKYLMLDNEVGSTIEDFDKRLRKSIQYANNDMNSECKKEIENARQTIFNIQNEFAPKHRAIAVLVKRINQRKYSFLDAGKLDEVANEISKIGLSKEMMDQIIEKVKKK